MARKRTSGIYAIQNTKNFCEYVGSTGNIETRWINHKRRLNVRTHLNHRLQEAWDKYGPESFRLIIIEETALLKEREKHFVERRMPEYNLVIVRNNQWVQCPEVVAAQKIGKPLTTEQMVELRESERRRLANSKL